MTNKKILVMNPNSNPEVTKGFSRAVDALRVPGGPVIECITNDSGPRGVESDADVAGVIPTLVRMVETRDDVDAFVVACYSDPGLRECRAATAKPVFGIQESALFAALQRGGNVGIIALADASIARHTRYIASLGLSSRVAGERPLHLTVAEAEAETAFPRICEIGGHLQENDHAAALILGCAGMSRHRQPLQKALALPVIDPTQAAVAQALGTVLLNASE